MAAELHHCVAELFEAMGTPSDVADSCATHLVRANLTGYDSHGVVHIGHYLEELEHGWVDPAGRPSAVVETPGTVLLDGNLGWGLHGGQVAMDLAIERAASNGIGAVSLRNYTHIGRLGHYVEHAARRGFISLITWGAGEAGRHLAAPFGGADPALSTNPFAFGAPTGDDRPLVVDFATTVIAHSKAWVLRDLGQPLPEGSALDHDGQATTDPATYMDDGMLVIFGAHKGYGISLLTCLLGALTGHLEPEHRSVEGPFFLALDPEAFQARETYERGVRAFLDGIRATPPAPGFDEVLIPGDLEARTRAERERSGIELTPNTVEALRDGATRLGVTFQLDGAPAAVSTT